jgi:hypothetical protein
MNLPRFWSATLRICVVFVVAVVASCGVQADPASSGEVSQSEALLDAASPKAPADGDDHDGEGVTHVHDEDAAADGHAGGHFTEPEGACAAGTMSTMHPDCVGNVGCTVNTIAPCTCGCEMCWQDACVELKCAMTDGCPDGG